MGRSREKENEKEGANKTQNKKERIKKIKNQNE